MVVAQCGAGNSAGGFPTLDISVSFGTSGGTLYAAILRGDDRARRMQILRSSAFSGTATMAVTRNAPDLTAWVVSQSRGNADRLWVGNNSLGSDHSATVDHTADARAATPTFDQTVLEVSASPSPSPSSEDQDSSVEPQ